jgi:crotonobetainyl-CoA:carnitine CoA-transferase CaiB-like acyl-CoA transferase
MTFTQACKALSRFTVLDLTRVRAGPTCVRELADWGANAIKIEQPAYLENVETDSGPRDDADFQNLHRNKRSMTLNLKSKLGRDAFLRMVEKADVVVENYRPDVKDRLGINYEDLRKINKGIVYASISGFGQDGPYRDRPGFDQIAQGMGGLMSITGALGNGPMRVGIPVADLSAGLFAAIGIMVALLDREVSGEGQWITTSLLEAQIFMLDFQAARWLQHQVVAKQAGNNHPTSIPTGVFKTKDGFINIAAGGQVMWERVCSSIEAPELVERSEFKNRALRSQNREIVNVEIEKRTVNKTSAEWIDIFSRTSVPCGMINSIDQVFADPQVKHLGIAQDGIKSDGTHQTFVGQPVSLSRTPSGIATTPPALGQHTDEVLREFGFADGEIAALHAAEAI